MILILDIDGTLADVTDRLPFIEKDPPDWDGFFDPELIAQDYPISDAQYAFPELAKEADKVIFLTGRPERIRKVTATWLKRHFGVEPAQDELFMRSNDSREKSVVEKERLLKKYILPVYGKEDLFFIDDEYKNIDMFDNYGTAFTAPDCWYDFARQLEKKHPIVDGEIYVPIEKVHPLHEVRNEKKLAELTQSMVQRGWSGRPLLVEPSKEGYQAWTGSHRLAAAKEAGLEQVPVVIIDYDAALAVVEGWGYKLEELRHGIGDSIVEDEERYDLLVAAKDYPAATLMHQEVMGNKVQEALTGSLKRGAW